MESIWKSGEHLFLPFCGAADDTRCKEQLPERILSSLQTANKAKNKYFSLGSI